MGRETPPQVMTIAGSDSGGGAGIQADLKAIHANGGYAVSVITSVTAQNTQSITTAYDLPLRVIEAQMAALFGDFDIRAVKTGMLASKGIVRRVALLLTKWNVPTLVVDPILRAKGGHPLLAPDALSVLKSDLIPQALLVTPNLPEAEALADMKILTQADMETAARIIHGLGCQAVLIKGGHFSAAPARDLFFDGVEAISIQGEWVQATAPHGTGCLHSAAIATLLARGIPLAEAIRTAKVQVAEAIRHALPIGHGNPPVNPHHQARVNDDPTVAPEPERPASQSVSQSAPATRLPPSPAR